MAEILHKGIALRQRRHRRERRHLEYLAIVEIGAIGGADRQRGGQVRRVAAGRRGFAGAPLTRW